MLWARMEGSSFPFTEIESFNVPHLLNPVRVARGFEHFEFLRVFEEVIVDDGGREVNKLQSLMFWGLRGPSPALSDEYPGPKSWLRPKKYSSRPFSMIRWNSKMTLWYKRLSWVQILLCACGIGLGKSFKLILIENGCIDRENELARREKWVWSSRRNLWEGLWVEVRHVRKSKGK